MIIQVLPSIAPHDAISQHVLRLDSALRERNIDTAILAHHVHPSFRDRVAHEEDFVNFDGLHILYHMSIASSLAEKVHSSNARVDMWYHNITPAESFQPWEPFVALELRIARYQFSQMVLRADRSIAASCFSEAELKANGARHTSVMPVLFDASTKVGVDHESHIANHKTDTKHILSVGRFAPHKKIEKMIETIALYRKHVSPDIALDLVGSSASRWYKESLDELIGKLDLADQVTFHEGVSDHELAHMYIDADAYLCLSEHEGFCVPLMESQCAGLPIVATRVSAIPETLGDAGVLVDSGGSLNDVVAALDVVLSNESLRSSLIAAGHHNVLDLKAQTTRAVDWLLEGSSRL